MVKSPGTRVFAAEGCRDGDHTPGAHSASEPRKQVCISALLHASLLSWVSVRLAAVDHGVVSDGQVVQSLGYDKT